MEGPRLLHIGLHVTLCIAQCASGVVGCQAATEPSMPPLPAVKTEPPAQQSVGWGSCTRPPLTFTETAALQGWLTVVALTDPRRARKTSLGLRCAPGLQHDTSYVHSVTASSVMRAKATATRAWALATMLSGALAAPMHASSRTGWEKMSGMCMMAKPRQPPTMVPRVRPATCPTCKGQHGSWAC